MAAEKEMKKIMAMFELWKKVTEALWHKKCRLTTEKEMKEIMAMYAGDADGPW